MKPIGSRAKRRSATSGLTLAPKDQAFDEVVELIHDARGRNLRLAARQGWSVRELAHQIDSALFERTVLKPSKVSTALRLLHPGAEGVFRDAYLVEFLAEHKTRLPDKTLLQAKLHEFYTLTATEAK